MRLILEAASGDVHSAFAAMPGSWSTWKISVTELASLVKFWNPLTVQLIQTLQQHFNPEAKLNCSAASYNHSPSHQTLYEHSYHSPFRKPACVLSNLLICSILWGSIAHSGESRTTETEELSKAESWKLVLSKPITYHTQKWWNDFWFFDYLSASVQASENVWKSCGSFAPWWCTAQPRTQRP